MKFKIFIIFTIQIYKIELNRILISLTFKEKNSLNNYYLILLIKFDFIIINIYYIYHRLKDLKELDK